jgi:hypothetical protein
MAVANTLAYYITATITPVKSFIVQAPDLDTVRFFPDSPEKLDKGGSVDSSKTL